LQAPQYLYDALKAFASGQRQSGIMWPIAAALTDEEMRALASQLGTSPPVAVPSAAPSAARVAGDAIAQGGVDGAAATAGAKRVERCTSCHRATVGLDRVIPRLAGQNAAYLRMQLHAFRNGGRGDTSSYDPMVPTSHALDDAEIAEVAAYYASREPVPKN
jgi:cytochrome c553